jgi:TonB family protein
MLLAILCLATQAAGSDNFVDIRDGQEYKVAQIGRQVWMKDNLNYKTDSSWCYDNKNSNCDKYGRLYKWVTAQKVCPNGWHLPKREEWFDLLGAIEGEESRSDYCACNTLLTKSEWEKMNREKFAGRKLKSKTQWNGADDYGFSALPGGMRYFHGGSFMYSGSFGYYWSSQKFGSEKAYFWSMRSNRESVEDGLDYNSYGFSVRCLRNELAPATEQAQPRAQKQSKCDCPKNPENFVLVSDTLEPGLWRLYNKYLKQKPDFGGYVTLKFTIDASGDVTNVSIVSSTTGYADFDNAVKDEVYTWEWKPIKSGSTTHTITLRFMR